MPVSSSNVLDIIKQKSGISFIIALIATVLQFTIAIPLGITSATKQYGVVDYSVTVLAMMGISLPSFFFGALLLRIFSIELGWFPYAGLTNPNSGLPVFIDNLHHLVLPITVLVILSIGGLMRYTRTNMLEVLNSDYIRTARAKGLSEHKVIYKHAFRNTLIPLVTILAGILPGLFGGAMITETIFSIDGIGKAAYKAVTMGDIPFVMTYNLFLALLTVIGTLLSDLMYAVVDPRVKLTGGNR
jgi:peptide/nickel transport system permease protein